MKYLLIICLLISLPGFSAEIFSLKLEDHQKVESTSSFKINDQSIHVLIIKNKNSGKYELIPFHVDSGKEVRKFDIAEFDDSPEILSHHEVGGNLTLSILADDKLDIVDFSLSSGIFERSSIEEYEKPEYIFKDDDHTVFLHPGKGKNTFEFTKIYNGSTVEKKSIPVPKDIKQELRIMLKTFPVAVNDEGFVKHSSIKQTQAYYTDGQVHFVMSPSFTNTLDVYKVPYDPASEVSRYEVSSSILEKVKDKNNYVSDSKLYAMYLGKSDVELQTVNLASGEINKSYSLVNDLLTKKMKVKFPAYLKESNRSKHKPTIVINTTVDGNLMIDLDYVDKNTYVYRNHLLDHMFWHFHMQSMMAPTGFGPNQFEHEIAEMFYLSEQDPIRMVFNGNFELLPEASTETADQFIDKEEVYDKLDDNKGVFNQSVAFFKETYRYISTDKKEKVLRIVEMSY